MNLFDFIKLKFIKDLQYSMVHATFIEILLNKCHIALYSRDYKLVEGIGKVHK